MHIDQIRTFLEVASTGNFNRAADNLNVTQSTVSARIRTLEDRLGRELFTRDHSGAQLTPSGERFQHYATRMLRLWRRAESDVSLPKQYRASICLGSAISLWDHLELDWVVWMRREVPDVAIHVMTDYSVGLMRQLADGAMDIGVMYEPRQIPGLVVEDLLLDRLFLLSTVPDCKVSNSAWRQGYIFIDWGSPFRREHDDAFPDLIPSMSVGLGLIALRYIQKHGGSAYLPLRMAHTLVRSGFLHRVQGAPSFERMGSVVFSTTPTDPDLVEIGLRGLRATTWQILNQSKDLVGFDD